ncbi:MULTISPECIES: membrane protein [unclassified Streptomyces]|uniref:membrane protein n=1 Tax=unclassified Streptomyces TaxID=2593676 RepID=UPI0004C473D4
MTKLLLSVHVLAAIVAIGPVTVAASMFPATLRRAYGDPADGGASGRGDALATLRTLHRICHVYAYVGVTVPVFGIATARSLGVLGDTWLIVSMALTAAAAGVLGLLLLPAQSRALEQTASGPGLPVPTAAAARLAMLTGVFNLLWATVTVLMIVRPGSTTGA